MNLPVEFLERMKAQLGQDYDEFVKALDKPPIRGLRVITLRISVQEFLGICPWEMEASASVPEGFILKDNQMRYGSHPYHAAGLYYIQEPSAMHAVARLDIRPGMRVLDLCAAPGGKSGAIAAKLQGQGVLIANEVVPARAKTIANTLERLGVANAAVTCCRPEVICEALRGWFDAVLVDAPCSGEGMFRKDEQAIREWSPEHVLACAARQKGILANAQKALKPGGMLVYSTCTFSPEENEGVIEDFLASSPEFELAGEPRRLYPHLDAGEGHFIAALRKTASAGDGCSHQELIPKHFDRSEYYEFMDAAFSARPYGTPMELKDGRVLLVPDGMPAELVRLRTLRTGVEAGTLIKGRFEPSHGLFMAARSETIRLKLDFAPDAPELLRFMRGETIETDAANKGYAAVTVDGFVVGFGKAAGGVLKNHLPKGLRIH